VSIRCNRRVRQFILWLIETNNETSLHEWCAATIAVQVGNFHRLGAMQYSKRAWSKKMTEETYHSPTEPGSQYRLV
jgi:hypothetical protein